MFFFSFFHVFLIAIANHREFDLFDDDDIDVTRPGNGKKISRIPVTTATGFGRPRQKLKLKLR